MTMRYEMGSRNELRNIPGVKLIVEISSTNKNEKGIEKLLPTG